MLLKDKIISIIYNYGYPLYYKFVYIKDKNDIYGYGKYGKPKKLKNRKSIQFWFKDGTNESGTIVPEMVQMILDLHEEIHTLLLDGDPKTSVDQIKEHFKIFKSSDIVTFGLGDKDRYDYAWDFEKDPPKGIPKGDLILSTAMFEHLLRPYKHLEDLTKLLNKNGHIMMHTHIPGYGYHRHPIDSIRFYPDWFEESAKRLNLKVVEKYQYDFHIIYHFQKDSR